MERNVIVAWDASRPAQAAVNWALHRQGSRPGMIRLVHVVDDGLSSEGSDVSALVREAQESLSAEAERVRLLAPSAKIVTDVILGDPERELRRLSVPGSLLVVGSHDRDESSTHYGWSLGAQLAPSARGGLAIVPEHVSGARSGVLVGVDGTVNSMAAALVAATEAVLSGEPLRVVHAWLEPQTGTKITALNREFIAWLKQANQDLLDDCVRPVETKFPQLPIVRLLENASPLQALGRHATTAALVVVGTRGYGAVRRTLLGSVSHSLILSMECPVIVAGESALSDEDRAPVKVWAEAAASADEIG